MNKYTERALHPEASDLNHAAYKSGCALFREGRYSNAKAAFEVALSYWPNDAQAWMALGNCQDALNKPKAAEASFREALKYCAEKDRDGIQFNLANSLLDQERFEDAILAYQQVSSHSPIYEVARRNLSLADASIRDSGNRT